MKVGDQEVFDHCCEATGLNVGSLYPLTLTLTNCIHGFSPKTDHVEQDVTRWGL